MKAIVIGFEDNVLHVDEKVNGIVEKVTSTCFVLSHIDGCEQAKNVAYLDKRFSSSLTAEPGDQIWFNPSRVKYYE